MSGSVNWSGVWQSITDTWLPMFGWVAVIVFIIALVAFIRNRKK